MGTLTKEHIKTEDLVKLRDQGWTLEAIGKEHGLSKAGVFKRLAAWEREKIARELPLPIKVDTSKPNIIGEILKMISAIDEKIAEVDKAAKKCKAGSRDRRDWEKFQLKLAMERRRLLALGTDTEYQLAQHQQTKQILHCILEEVGRESKECQRRILSRLKAIGNS